MIGKFHKPPRTPSSTLNKSNKKHRKTSTYNKNALSKVIKGNLKDHQSLPINKSKTKYSSLPRLHKKNKKENNSSSHTIMEEDDHLVTPSLINKSSGSKRVSSNHPNPVLTLEMALANFTNNISAFSNDPSGRVKKLKVKNMKKLNKVQIQLPPALNLPKIDKVSTPSEMSFKSDYEGLDTDREIRKILLKQAKVVNNKTIVRETKSSLIRKRMAKENKMKDFEHHHDVGIRYRHKLNSKILVLNKQCNDAMRSTSKLQKIVGKIEEVVNSLDQLIKKSEKERKQKITLKEGILIQLQQRKIKNRRNLSKVSEQLRMMSSTDLNKY
ncbi:unnamed protein product [Moneuplotes crassus]|uniref:Uncharacterized protein n=1 Tax=Euplotes crassus TaxID=5936 RepID=A0AAD1UKD1_EUPCR|nr:unnamed protein product [Moneuplotes crassus]